MFGQKSAFGAPSNTGFGNFGSSAPTNPFGATASAFGHPQQQQQQQQQSSLFGGGAFGGATAPATSGGSLFGAPSAGLFGATSQPATSTTSFGGFGSTAGTST